MNISENMNVHQWAQDMAEQKASELTRKQWCDSKGIQLSTYDYRCRKVRRILEKKMNEQQDNGTAIISPKCGQTHLGEAVFAKVNLQASQSAASGIHIRLSDAELAIVFFVKHFSLKSVRIPCFRQGIFLKKGGTYCFPFTF